MGMMNPVFREMNFSRITELASAKKLSNTSIASIISDETKQKVTASDVGGYLKLNRMASQQMLVSKPTMNAISGAPSSDLKPA